MSSTWVTKRTDTSKIEFIGLFYFIQFWGKLILQTAFTAKKMIVNTYLTLSANVLRTPQAESPELTRFSFPISNKWEIVQMGKGGFEI